MLISLCGLQGRATAARTDMAIALATFIPVQDRSSRHRRIAGEGAGDGCQVLVGLLKGAGEAHG